MITSADSRTGARHGAASTRWLAAAILVAVGSLAASPAAGQDYRASIGWGLGVASTTSLNDGADAAVALEPDAAPLFSVYGERWFGRGLTGLRLQVSGSQQQIDWRQGPRDIPVYTAEASLLLRLGAARPERTVIPFVGLGVGVNWWLLGKGSETTYPEAGALYAGEEGFDPVGVGSVGFDIITRLNWGEGPLVVRVQAADAVQLESPFEPIEADAGDFGTIHNLHLSIGLHTGVGRLPG